MLLVALAGIVAIQLGGNGQSGTDDATIVWMNCLADATKRLDDGTSDASTIAKATVSQCYGQFRHFVDVLTEGSNPQVRQQVLQRMDQQQIGVATRVVLEVRTSQKAKAQR